jgi:hypothetical protein
MQPTRSLGLLTIRGTSQTTPVKMNARGRTKNRFTTLRRQFEAQGTGWKPFRRLAIIANSTFIADITLAYFTATHEGELLDLEKDPLQMRSVSADPGKSTNVFTREPDKAKERFAILKADIARGRSRCCRHPSPSTSSIKNLTFLSALLALLA